MIARHFPLRFHAFMRTCGVRIRMTRLAIVLTILPPCVCDPSLLLRAYEGLARRNLHLSAASAELALIQFAPNSKNNGNHKQLAAVERSAIRG